MFQIHEDFGRMYPLAEQLVAKWDNFFKKLSSFERRSKEILLESLLESELNSGK